ncbi:CLUMA_CG008621, isoform A [Clunio marinus]|uniref:CLUMA_CG008621, isoform A n=1 Tax=Clunio marinus TaxID=568069 RepID=A0A1J1I4B2_9DIPT|nr:CLUMA_CG008621, isoform A [Clunio marinus]
MKVFVGLLLSLFVLQTFATPVFENPDAPEHIPKNDPLDVVERFRTDVDYWFVRYQNFYDRANAAMRDYRFAHVDLVTRVYNDMMEVFGDDIEAIRQTAYDLNDVIAERQAQLGADNACLQGVMEEMTQNSARSGANIQSCALYANSTLETLLTNVFYPTFIGIQETMSTVPVAVVDALSRGNVLQDEEAIVEFLEAGYRIYERQWITAVSQLLRWETNRFQTDGLFLVDEMRICLSGAVVAYIVEAARLTTAVQAC